MTDKRFIKNQERVHYIDDGENIFEWVIYDTSDNNKVIVYTDMEKEANICCNLLNELHEEKELWKRECKRLKGLYYLENENIRLDDIIGLVRTDEPTDSVELKKELYK